jgi:hypothetical protein
MVTHGAVVSDAKATFHTLDDDPAAAGAEQCVEFNCPMFDRRCGPLVIAGRTNMKRDPQGQNGGTAQWYWNGNREAPTLQPSVNCKGCWHGYIRNGQCVTAASGTPEPDIKRIRT